MSAQEHIWVKAFCVFFRNDDREVLLIESRLPDGRFRYAPIGGTVEHLELSKDAAAREVKEETGYAVSSLRLLNVLENILEVDGRPIHEIIFLYRAEFADDAPRGQDLLQCVEADGRKFTAVWRKVAALGDPGLAFYPTSLRKVLTGP